MRWSALCVFMALAALGCERSSEADSDSKSEGSAVDEAAPGESKGPIESLPQVDVSALDDFSRSIWVDMVNELLSPCGDPVSVARCVAENRKCKRCVPAARYVARLVDEGYSRDEIREIYRVRYDADTKVKLSHKGSPLRGSPMAPVTIYEFSDFQCPHCRLAAPYLKKIVDDSNGKVKLVFKQYPLPGHPKAREAAKAAIAADRQGKFWEMHDLIFKNQAKLETANFENYAKELGLDLERFRVDLKSKEVETKIEADRAEGKKIGVDSTPSIYVNDRRFVFPPEQLAEYIHEELDQ
ncbi:MAG: DsbA family protein [Myxococcales bacterium]|nr:DsbA family protein [Myxococcales bacterium]MDH3483397.1 DsbA family protein [Myxococcales bacterium]